MFGFYFLKTPGAHIRDYETAKEHADTERFSRFYHAMLERGFYFAPSQFEAGFLSSAHTEADVRHTVDAVRDAFAEVVTV
jgi:glutamate-1-semialdehyde 2,1-aminomutase